MDPLKQYSPAMPYQSMSGSVAWFVLLSTALVALILKILVEVGERQQRLGVFKRGNVPCLPVKSAITGNIYDLFLAEDTIGTIHRHHQNLGLTYGTFYGPYPWAFTCDPDLLHKLFVTESHRTPYKSLFHVPYTAEFGKSVAQVHGDEWVRMRRVLNPSFTNKQMKSDNVFTDVEDASRALLDTIAAHPKIRLQDGREARLVDVWTNGKKYTMDSVFRVAYGKADMVNMKANESDQIVDTFAYLNRQLSSSATILTVLLGGGERLINFLVGFTKIGASFRFLHRILDGSVDERRRNAPHPSRKMIDHILESLDKFDEETVKANLFFMFVAGFETTSSSVALSLWLLAKHPDKQAKLRASVVADGADSKYLDWCIRETLRLFPPVPAGIGRELKEDLHHKGMTFYKGTSIISSIYSLHHLREYWGDDVEEFRPERFAQASHHHPAQWFAFSAGARVCIGQNLAMLELRIALSQLLVRYSVELGPNTLEKIHFTAPNLINIIVKEKLDLCFVELKKGVEKSDHQTGGCDTSR